MVLWVHWAVRTMVCFSSGGSRARAPQLDCGDSLSVHTDSSASSAKVTPLHMNSVIPGCGGAPHRGDMAPHRGDMALHTGGGCRAAALLSEAGSSAGGCSCGCLHVTEPFICFLAISHS